MDKMNTAKQYQEMIKGSCPWCGEPLELKKGKHGEFIACSEWCGYTKSVPGRSEYPSPQKDCRYKKCDGSGLIPFVKNGRTVPFAWVHCECREDKEPYQSHRIEDFDFPMSDSFRGYSFQYCGETDPGYMQRDITDEELMPIKEVIKEEISYKQLDSIRGQLIYIQNKLNNHLDKKRTTYTIE